MEALKTSGHFGEKKWKLDLVFMAEFQENAYKFGLFPCGNTPINVLLNVKRTEARVYD